ncbi:MAG: hypothetical protein JWO20_1470 [Candidatus Angelobacter sp.]|nr:hypothetical protein [Candidatus Angelobacter sp.]
MKTRNANVIAAALLLAAVSAVAQNQPKPAAKPAAAPTVSTVLNRSFSGVEGEFVPLAEAMPEDKYNFAPTNGEFKGVRTFGAMVKHVAVTNNLLAAAMLGEKAPATGDEAENGPESVKTKAQIMAYLKDSFANLHKAAAATNDANLMAPIDNAFGGSNKMNRLGASMLAFGHTFDHYGQLVEYLRMNGIIPPASRPPAK